MLALPGMLALLALFQPSAVYWLEGLVVAKTILDLANVSMLEGGFALLTCSLLSTVKVGWIHNAPS